MKKSSARKSGQSKTRNSSTLSRDGKPLAQLSEVLHEYIIGKTASKFQVRIGRTWKLPKMRGKTWLSLDYDGTQRVYIGAIRYRLRSCGMQVLQILKRRSPGNHGIHVRIQVESILNRWQIIALQAICQSDLTRECFNFRRGLAASSDEEWTKFNVLFEKEKQCKNSKN